MVATLILGNMHIANDEFNILLLGFLKHRSLDGSVPIASLAILKHSSR